MPALPLRSLLAAGILAALLAIAPPLAAGGGPGEVVLVVNGDSPASLAVANAWIAARGIDPTHVVVLRDLPGHERITIEEFRGRILLPVVLEMDRRGLASQVQWIVYSADLPTAVDFAADLPLPPPMIGRWASLTGLTVLAPLVTARDTAYCLARGANPYYRRNDIERKLQWDTLPEAVREPWEKAMQFYRDKQYRQAADLLAPLAAATGDPGVTYDYACDLALAGDATAAMTALEAAERAGWSNAQHTQTDTDLDSLHALPAFTALIGRLTAFRHPAPDSLAWDRRLLRRPDGDTGRAERPVGGWLSTMLAVTSGRGLSVAEALALIRRARSADGTRPDGTFCLMRNDDVRSTTRRWAFAGTVGALRELGAKAEVVDGVLPDGRSDVAGLVAGSAGFDWPRSGATMLPGAIAEHLTSCGGMMGWDDGQTPLTEFLRHGAAGSSGAVEEPYALQYKFPSPFVQVHYRRGSTLGEAMYQAIANPYHLLVVGDPLCAPWAEPPAWRLTAPEIRDGRLELAVERGIGPALMEVRLQVDGVQAWSGAPGPIVLPTQGWSAGPHRLAVTGVGAPPLATQTCASFTVETGIPASLACTRASVALDGTLDLAWETPAGSRGVLTHLGRDLAALPGGRQRTLSLPASILGLGHSDLQLEVRDADGRLLARSRPLPVEIAPPALRPAAPEPATSGLGVRLTPDGQGATSATAATGRMLGGWLAAAVGAERAGGGLAVDWWQRVADGGLAQVQLRCPLRKARLLVDDAAVELNGGTWRFGLTALAPGWHRFRLELGPGSAEPELRLGIAGTAPIALDGCRCPTAAAATPSPSASSPAP